MKLEIPRGDYDAISSAISSADSPVGIDAQKTHVIIIKKLLDIERRLARLEEKLGG